MMYRRARLKTLLALAGCLFTYVATGQCPSFSNFSVTGNSGFMCEGEMLTVSLSGQNISPGSSVEYYLGTVPFNPYNAEGDLIGSVPVMVDECNNTPEVLYIMVNPDNVMVGSSNDKCDEFMVIWTGSGGFSTTDIVVSNLSTGAFQWDDFVSGDASGFSCGVALPPGPVPPNAILIIQGALTNNVFINSDVLCASGLPVYIISNNNTDCTLGWFDNDSPCASCPVQIDITGVDCSYSFNLNYAPPASSTNGWGWSNMGSGVFADIVPPVDIPVYQPTLISIPNFVWTVPNTFCENYGEGEWMITGILNPAPTAGCPEIFTPYFDANVSCPELILSGGGDVCEGNCPDAPNQVTFTITGDDVPFLADLQVTASTFPPYNINDIEIFNGQQIDVCLGGLLPSFDPVTNILTIPSFAIGLTATVTIISLESESGCPVMMATNSIDLHFIEAPTADAGPDEVVCSDSQITLNGILGGSGVNAMWTTNGDGIFSNPSNVNTLYTPGVTDSINGSVTLTLTSTDANGACIPAESTLLLTVEPYVSVDVGPSLTVCNTDVVNVMAVVSGPQESGTWESDGDGVFDNPFDESTFYTPGPFDLANGSVTLFYNIDGSGICLAPNVPLEVTFVNAPNVVIPQDLEICIDDILSININVSGNYTSINWFANGDGNLVVLNNMSVEYTPGPQDIIDEFTIISVIVVSGFSQCGQTTYNLPVFISSCGCPDFETTQPPSLCSQGAGLVLVTLLQSGGPGEWSITSTPPGSNPATITGGIFLTTNSDPGIYTLTYTLDSPEPGCPATSSENITVLSPIIPEAGANIANCGPGNVFLNGTVIPFGPANTVWQTLGDGSFVNPLTLATTYIPGPNDSNATEIILLLHVLDPVCGNRTDSVRILFPEPPLTLFLDDTISICNQEDKGSVLNFSSLITGGDSSGIWTNTGGVPVNFSNPDSVNFDGITEGFYIFNYQTNSAMFPCQEVDYPIVIEVEDCICPTLDAQLIPPICNTIGNINLAAFISAGASGTWQVLNAPVGSNPAIITGSTLQTLDKDGGQYRLRFTLDTAPITACPDSAELDVFIQEQPAISLPNDTLVCSDSPVTLDAVIGGSAIDVLWTGNGSGIFSDTTGVTTVYTFSQDDIVDMQVIIFGSTVDTFGICQQAIDSAILNISEIPYALFSETAASICNNPDSGSILNLNSFLIGGDLNGPWIDAGGAGVDVSNAVAIDFDGVPAGSYLFHYVTSNATVPCTNVSYDFTVIVRDCSCPPLAIQHIDLVFCEGEQANLDSLLIIDAAPGSWSLSQGPSGMWPVINDSLITLNSGTAGNYTLTYTLTDSIGGCPASDEVLLTVEEPSSISLITVECDQDLMSYDVIVSTNASGLLSDFGSVINLGGGQFRIENVPADQDILIEAISTLQVCFSTLFVDAPACNCTLFINDIPDSWFLCPGDTLVLIPLISGAIGPVVLTWISGETFMQPELPLYEENNWILIVRDSAGCEQRDTFDVAILGSVELGPDITINFGDSVLIEPLLSDILIQEIVWDPLNLNVDINPFWYKPDQTILIHLSVTDSLGCVFEDEQLITVVINLDFYVPTIFSPNNDFVNDVVEVSTSLNHNNILSLEIFDRWGSLLYSQMDLAPFRWDGISKGKPAPPGVYVVKVIYKDENGNNKVYVSDLTLIR